MEERGKGGGRKRNGLRGSGKASREDGGGQRTGDSEEMRIRERKARREAFGKVLLTGEELFQGLRLMIPQEWKCREKSTSCPKAIKSYRILGTYGSLLLHC